MTRSWLSRRTRVEMVSMRPIPASAARATTASSSLAKSGKSRWQWLSTSMGVSGRGRFDVAREYRDRRGQRCARRNSRGAAEHGKKASVARDAETIEQPDRGDGHRRLSQDRDLADHLGGDIEHRLLPFRIGLG